VSSIIDITYLHIGQKYDFKLYFCRSNFWWEFIIETWLVYLDIAMKETTWHSSMNIWPMEIWNHIF
jgi:hypothetical protein